MSVRCVNNLTLDKYPCVWYIITMMNDLHDMIRTSCEEAITPDVQAQLEHEAQPEQPTHKEVAGVCEDAPCCGCCGPSYDEVADSYAADAWHDAHEYPEW